MQTPIQSAANGDSAPKQAAQKAASGELGTQQFVTFLVNDELFGVPMGSVREIIRMPALVQVPLSPPSLDGLANLRGKVLPIIDLRSSFKFSRAEHSDSTRVIVADCGALVGFVVDRVSSVISIDWDRIEPAATIQGTVDTRMMTGVIKPRGASNEPMVVLLDLQKVLGEDFSSLQELGASTQANSSLGTSTSREPQDAAAAELQLVSFQVAGQEYAFPINRVQEIVQVPSGFCEIPNTQSHVLGVMTLRDRLLPIVSLRELFHLPRTALEEQNRIVVLTLDEAGTTSVGIVMDRVKEVLRLPASCVGQLPGLLTRESQTQEVDAICQLDSGKRLVSVLSVEKMFRHQVISEALGSNSNTVEEEQEQVEESRSRESDDEAQMVVFRLGAEEYGVAIDSVQEILRVADQFTHVPHAAEFIEGLISLRGAVLPVVDLRRRFNMPDRERDERQRIMVFSVGGVRTGVIVDAVLEVLKVPSSSCEAAPRLSARQAEVIKRVANLERQKRMVLVLEAERLFDSAELGQLRRVDGPGWEHSSC
ncbi:MAG TPA: chemotaxis protein CheW [Polyangiaceae bacterium]|nr:chemotaxis protein CheW [Polyangiaceae bacterium]